jgi:hypothetical protein
MVCRFIHFLLLMISIFAYAPHAEAIDWTQVEQQLQGQGVQGYVHGAVADRSLYVFTIQNPNDFFDRAEISLIAASPAVSEILGTLSRHDLVRVRGRFIPVPVPQRHLEVSEIEVLTRHTTPYPTDPYNHEAEIPLELLGQDQAVFSVHAVQAGGRVVVLEYRDQVLPLFVRNPQQTANLSRNDIVRIRYRIRAIPDQPSHLELLDSASDAVEVLESVAVMHEQAADVEGALVLFPQAPGIRLNVFAIVEERYPTALRQYTLINFVDPALFRAIVAKMQEAWDRYPGAYRNGRNKLISTCLRVRAIGRFNQVDPNQANTQILIDRLDDLIVSDHCMVR